MFHFLHGLIGSPLHFQQVMRQLRPSGVALCAPTLDYLSHDLPSLARKVAGDANSSSAVIVGNSIGCQLALQLPIEARAYVLTAPPFDYSRGTVPLRRAQIGPWVDDLYQGKGHISDEAEIRAEACTQLAQLLANRHNIGRIRSLKAQSQDFLSNPKLKQAQARIHFVIGEDDYTTPVDAFRAFVAQNAPGARITVVPNCGHSVPVERPDVVAKIAREEAYFHAEA
ncbi:alpha/beta fold hydrolase [Litoreibacter halocynthiae]|uniref:alpha/beta fold hydrolase n=1 Tax=Litoreibacter halocynthiae TaxID=1242689 RepID=UPI002490DBA3|nr:alpha/beta hydrolase [Litoreibacter halocynthiae]